MKHIVLGVTGSIAAYKAADLAHRLTKEGYGVHVILTQSAQEFITPLTFRVLTGNRVSTDMFERVDQPDVEHISLAKQADLILLAPATANLIGKLAGGIADDMLTTVAIAAWRKQAIICPAMNTAMYENPVVQENMKKLAQWGYCFVEPKEALLACGDIGRGALAETDEIVAAVKKVLEN